MKVMLDNGAYLIEKAHREDAGYDIRTPEAITVAPRDSVFIDTGIHVAIPEGYVGMLKSRSSLNKKGIQTEGVIDCGYTGSIGVKIYNHSDSFYIFNKGDKITQLVVLPIYQGKIELVKSLEETERGNGGFGSTGK